MDDYVILPNITSDIELGRFLVDTGYKDFPEAVLPYLDYGAIGSEYYADHGGAYGPGGYVRRKGSLEQTSDGVRQTEFGLIRRCSRPFPEEAQGQQMGGIM